MPDPLVEVRRRLSSSRAKRLATDELDGETLGDEGTSQYAGSELTPTSLNPGESLAGGVYRSRHAARGVGEGAAMGADQRLNEGTGSQLLVSEAIRAASDAQRRLGR